MLFFFSQVFSQSTSETAVLDISKKIFQFEVSGKIDSLSEIFDDNLTILSSSGLSKTKIEYLADLKAGKPVHNSIDIKEASVKITGHTAVLTGKGIFVVSVNQVQATFTLSYMEVFTEDHNSWKLLGLHASRLAN
jgi:hypothetical protein